MCNPILVPVSDEHETSYNCDAPVVTQSLTNIAPAPVTPSYPVALRPSRIRAEESTLVPKQVTPPPEPIRSIKDKIQTETDHTLTILN